MTSPAPLIHIVDDDESFRISLGRLLQAAGYRTKLYESGDAFLAKPPAGEPGCVLLDMQMNGMNGFQLQEHLSTSDNILPVVFLTAHANIPASVQAMRGGAEDYLSKPVGNEALLAAVERALARYAERSERQERLASMRKLVARLTPRETEVFSLVVRGKPNKQIASELGTSERTIKAHRQAVMEKLRVNSFAEAVSIAERLGLLRG
jgi:RNA polymerase sigma factor (sigma-70 family)